MDGEMRFCLLARDDSLIEIDLIEKRLDPNTMLLTTDPVASLLYFIE